MSTTFAAEVNASLEAGAAHLTDLDSAAVHLARFYADGLDAGEDPAKIGPLLLATLTALGLTPKARTASIGGRTDGNSTSSGNPLDELRARRSARARPAS